MRKKAAPAKPLPAYDRLKEFDGERYTGMAVGRTHHWMYDRGHWRERKVAPDRWEVSYATVKRRKGHAPEKSGVPVGTGYHWLIFAHQYVEKLNADDYTTQLTGLKFKLAHKRAAKGTWSASSRAQRDHLVEILREIIADLEKEPEQVAPIPLSFTHARTTYDGRGIPVPGTCHDGTCESVDVTLNDKHLGIARRDGKGWKLSGVKSQALVRAIGAAIEQAGEAAAPS